MPQRGKINEEIAFLDPAGMLFLGLSFGVRYAEAAAGSLGATFGTNGVTITSVAKTDSIANSMLLLSDDKILVFAGGATLVQYTGGGPPDTTFGNDGVVVLSTPIGGSLTVQSNGQIRDRGSNHPDHRRG